MTDRVAALRGSWGGGTSGSTFWMDRTFVVNATPTPLSGTRLIARNAAAIEKGDLGTYPVVNATTHSGGGIVRNIAVNQRERATIRDATTIQELGGVPAHAATAK